MQAQLTKSFASAEAIAAAVPAVLERRSSPREAVVPRRRDWAYTAGIVAILLGAALVFFMFPKQDEEKRLLAEYHAEDTSAAPEHAALDGT